MSNPENKIKPIVGDDGELLEPDTHIDMAIYNDYAADEFPPPTRLERLRYFASNNPVAWIAVLIISSSIVIVMWHSASLEVRPTEWSKNSGELFEKLLVPTLEPLFDVTPEQTSTQVPKKKIIFQLPTFGNVVHFSPISNVTKIRWSPDGKYLALQGGSNLVALWDLNKNRFLYYGSQAQSNMDWSPDSQYLYLTFHRFINAHQNPLLTSIPLPVTSESPHLMSLKQPPWLENGLPKLLVTSSHNQTAVLSSDGLSLSIVDANQPTWLVTRKLDSPAHDLDWTPDGRWLSAVTETGVWKWLPNSAAFLVVESQYQQASWSLDGTQIAVTQDIVQDGLHHPTISVINPYHHQLIWTKFLVTSTKSIKSLEDFNVQVAWSPDGKQIATFVQNDTAIDLWDAKTGKNLARFYNKTAINCIDWSPDGKYIAIGSDLDVTIWSLT